MAEAILISAVGGLLKTLWDKFQQAKDIARVTDLEFQLLTGFMEQVNTFSKILGSHSSTEKGTNLRKALAQAETKLQLWCSKKSGFLLRSSDERYGELKVLRQSVETALELENLRRQEQHRKNVESMLGKLIEQAQAKNPPKKDPKPSPGQQKTAPPKGKPSRGQMITKSKDKDQSKPRSKSADRGKPSKTRIPDSPSQLPSSSRPRSSSADNTRNGSRVADGKKSPTSRSTKVDSAGNQSNNKDGKTHKQQSWQYLWVSMDSEFQADEMKKRLEGVQGVKRVTCDQPSQKVSVQLREGSHVRTDALLEHARQANPLKRNPTLWADRPR